MDVVRLMTSFHNPEYQYIPALALPKADQLNLQLNSPPSFEKPKSVMVVALPPVEAAETAAAARSRFQGRVLSAELGGLASR